MKKVLSACLAFFILFLVGCESTSSNDTILINTATSYGGDAATAPAYAELIADFITKNEKIEVSDNSAKADDDWKNLIRSQFDAGQEPDVMFFFNSADAKSMIENKQVVSLDTIRKIYPDYAENIKPDALDNMVESDGNIYAVPVAGFWEGLFYNSELFQKFNVPTITDWNSLLNAIEIFNKNNIVPIAASFSDIPNYWIEHSILAAGGTTKHYSNPKNESEIPVEWTEGLTLLNDLFQKNAFQVDCLNTQHELAINLYNQGKAAMILEGSWLSFPENIEEVTRVTKIPSLATVDAEEQGILGGFSMGFYISTKAWDDPLKRDACVKFVKHMTSNDSISKLCVQGAPAADVPNNNEDPIVNAGIEMCNKYKMQLPIDARLSKPAWEYLRNKTGTIVSGEAKAKDVLIKATELNK